MKVMSMRATLDTGIRTFSVDLGRPLPISIRMRHGEQNPVAWYAPYPSFEPVRMEGFVGSVKEGGSVNTRDIRFNPHGNGTHTECIGHLTEEVHQVDEYIRDFMHAAQVITLEPHRLEKDHSEFVEKGDWVIRVEELGDLSFSSDVKALVIRTTPNGEEKLTKTYTGNNPPYFMPEALAAVRRAGIEHLLVDLPSVDRENDGGKMLAHRAFWYEGNGAARMHASITEMVYVPDNIADGEYLLNLMISPFGNDAAPSKPVLYRMI
jgi:kynurenine formamidase